MAATAFPQQQSAELNRFSLDFPGGTPKALVAAIQQAQGEINVRPSSFVPGNAESEVGTA